MLRQSIFIILSNFIVFWKKKLLQTYQRPIPISLKENHFIVSMLDLIVYLSFLVNSAVIAFGLEVKSYYIK
jgi:hypothetical protein